MVKGTSEIKQLICSKCKLAKPETEFSVNAKRPSGRQAYCKPCAAAYRKETPSKVKNGYRIKYLYKVTNEEVEEMFKRSNGQCYICSKPLSLNSTEKSEQAHIDHCHDTGKVRGILCHHCNAGLGRFRDNTHLFLRASAYLNQSRRIK